MPGQASPERRRARTQESVHDEVGQELRAHREGRGLSLRELARRLGISPSAISQIETGKSRPSVSTLYSIVTELGMSLDELFSEDGSKPTRRVAGPAVTPAQLQPVRESDGPSERHVQRAGRRLAIALETGVRWERLTP